MLSGVLSGEIHINTSRPILRLAWFWRALRLSFLCLKGPYSFWFWGRLRTSMLPARLSVKCNQCEIPRDGGQRTLNNIEAAAGLALGVLVGADGSIALNKDHGTTQKTGLVKLLPPNMMRTRCDQAQCHLATRERQKRTPWGGP